MWTIYSGYEELMSVYSVLCVVWPVVILFGCRGKILKQEFCKQLLAPAGKEGLLRTSRENVCGAYLLSGIVETKDV